MIRHSPKWASQLSRQATKLSVKPASPGLRIAGLITVDPSPQIMILTKENVASQAFAEHIIGLSLPAWIERKFGRLVGFMALQNQTTSCTRLDVPTAHRHDVHSSKQVITGCGGGFRHERASRYSPVAQWMSEVDLFFELCCARHYNRGSHEAVLKLSLLDNPIKRKGQEPKKQSRQQQTPHKNTKPKQPSSP